MDEHNCWQWIWSMDLSPQSSVLLLDLCNLQYSKLHAASHFEICWVCGACCQEIRVCSLHVAVKNLDVVARRSVCVSVGWRERGNRGGPGAWERLHNVWWGWRLGGVFHVSVIISSRLSWPSATTHSKVKLCHLLRASTSCPVVTACIAVYMASDVVLVWVLTAVPKITHMHIFVSMLVSWRYRQINCSTNCLAWGGGIPFPPFFLSCPFTSSTLLFTFFLFPLLIHFT